jgi:regulator of replication initiation timing
MIYMDSKDVTIKEAGPSKDGFVEELIYENIDLMNENIRLMLENRELKKSISNLKTIY